MILHCCIIDSYLTRIPCQVWGIPFYLIASGFCGMQNASVAFLSKTVLSHSYSPTVNDIISLEPRSEKSEECDIICSSWFEVKG